MNDDVQEIAESPYQIEIKKAWDLFHDDEIDQCMEICEVLINEYPEKSSCHYILGHVFRIKKLYQKCVDEFLIAQTNDDGGNAGYICYWLGEAYGESGFMDDENKYVHDKQKSEEYYKKARTCESFPPDLLNRNDYKLTAEEKVQTYELGISKFPDLADHYVKLAQHYGSLGLSELQLKTFEKALSRKLTNASLFYNTANFYYKKNDFTSAHYFFNEALQTNQDYPSSNFAINYMLGKTAEKMNDYAKAESYYGAVYAEKSEYHNEMFGFFGLISVYMLSDNADNLRELIMNLDVNLNLLTNGDCASSYPVSFSRFVWDHVHFEGLEEICKQYNKLKFPATQHLLNGKYWMIRYLMANSLSKYKDQYKAVINVKKFVTVYQFGFLNDLHNDALSSLLYYQTDNLRDVNILYDTLIKDMEGNTHVWSFVEEHINAIANTFFEHGLYEKLVKIAGFISIDKLETSDELFKFAFAYADSKNYDRAKHLYQHYLKIKGESSAVLNNLGILIARDEKYNEAIELYQRGLMIDPDDTHLKNNLKNAQNCLAEKEEQTNREENSKREYKASLNALKSENDYVLEKLLQFITEVKKDEGFNNWEVPLAKFKFQKYIGADKQRAESLTAQWLTKGYIKDTGYKHDFNVTIYAINPYIQEEIKRLEKRKIPQEWINSFVNVNVDALDNCGYFLLMARIAKTGKKFRVLLERDFKELTYNHLVGHQKSTIVLSGSLVELALIYYCEKKKLTSITWKDVKGTSKTKALYDCVLYDLITYMEQSKIFSADFVHLGNLSRIYRNFVHPGKELKSSLDKAKADLCFLSTVELLKNIL